MKKNTVFLAAAVFCLILTGGCAKKVAVKGPEQIAAIYQDIYEQSEADGTTGSLSFMQAVVERLGEAGYVAIDTENENQVNMSNYIQLEQFIQQTAQKQDGEIDVYSVLKDGGLLQLNLKATDGDVLVTRRIVSWENGTPKLSYEEIYAADGWTYSDSYLFFDKKQPAGYDGAPGFTALRVEPLEDICRKLNQSYIMPVGYSANNLFLINWDETDFSKLDFYDLFHALYTDVYAVQTPYDVDVNTISYDVPKEEFEKVIQSYFNIDEQTLQKYASYNPNTQTYTYTARSFDNCAMAPDMPYPEVVAYTENADHTMTLTVNTVWPKAHLAKAFCHETVIRPENGGFQYAANRVIPTNSVEPEWYEDK